MARINRGLPGGGATQTSYREPANATEAENKRVWWEDKSAWFRKERGITDPQAIARDVARMWKIMGDAKKEGVLDGTYDYTGKGYSGQQGQTPSQMQQPSLLPEHSRPKDGAYYVVVTGIISGRPGGAIWDIDEQRGTAKWVGQNMGADLVGKGYGQYREPTGESIPSNKSIERFLPSRYAGVTKVKEGSYDFTPPTQSGQDVSWQELAPKEGDHPYLEQESGGYWKVPSDFVRDGAKEGFDLTTVDSVRWREFLRDNGFKRLDAAPTPIAVAAGGTNQPIIWRNDDGVFIVSEHERPEGRYVNIGSVRFEAPEVNREKLEKLLVKFRGYGPIVGTDKNFDDDSEWVARYIKEESEGRADFI